MSIESLKQQARKHEQKEEWRKALDLYTKALAELERDDQVDISLYNRVGDLFVRVGQIDQAVEHYEKAVDLYREAYLPNNAIAVCKKIIRHVPDRHRAYLVIGQVRAEQGFLPDARTNFLTYAERMQQSGDLDESFRALIEFCDLAPDDVGVRITVAEQMVTNGRREEAVEQLMAVHRHYTHLADTRQAEDMKSRILAINPNADFDALPPLTTLSPSEDIDDGYGGFGEISFGGPALGGEDEQESSEAMEEAMAEASADGVEAAKEEPEPGQLEVSVDEDERAGLVVRDGADDDDAMEFEIQQGASFAETSGWDDEDEVGEPLPMLDFADGVGDEPEQGEPVGQQEESTSPVVEERVEVSEDSVPELSLSSQFADEEDPAGADPSSDEPLVHGEAASAVEGAAEDARGEDASRGRSDQDEDDGAPDGGYVDLGAMILGGTQEKKSTRFTVAYEEPTGDEDADFAKMLSQFKDKVSENLDAGDVRAHYDLGTAYKEMGLLDEAISSFQAALRASSDHLPTYELMGQTFIDMGKPEAAVRSLERALQSAHTVEDELVGIYYYLGRAHEALENRGSAVEYYDRVFALDINFADVTERLRDLR